MNSLIGQLILLQVALPALLIFLNGWVVATTKTGWSLRVLGIALLLLYLTRTGIWLFPPWWTPWLLVALHVLLSAYALTRIRVSAPRRHYTEIILGTVLCGVATALLLPTFEGRKPPRGTVSLQAPLATGHYLVISGGTTRAINNHLMTLYGEQFRAYRGQSYAVDLIGIDQWGLRVQGISPSDPTKYLIYGRQVVSPCTGTVSVATDGVANMPVPMMDRQHMLGNHVILQCQKFYVVLAHLAPGSLVVSTGATVKTGDPLGAVGNTGNTAEPHLHVHVQGSLPDELPVSGEPLWFTLDDRFLVRNDVFSVD